MAFDSDAASDEQSVLVSVEPLGRTPGPRTLTFSHGVTRTVARSVVRAVGIEDRLGEDYHTIEASITDIEYKHALERAARALGSRDRSVHELRSKLREAGFCADAAERAIERLVELDLLDDARFAASWVRHRRAAGYGQRRILDELRFKGVDDAVLAQARAAFNDDDELARACESVRGSAQDPRVRLRETNRLVRRGYSFDVARKAVSESTSETHE
jgi:regulatory protein